MLDGLFMLLSLSILMALASFLAGSLPLSFSLSQSQLKLISTIGMGVLAGTSLIVIIPEGVETLYSASEVSQSHIRRQLPPSPLRWHSNQPYSVLDASTSSQAPSLYQRMSDEIDAINALPGLVIPADLQDITAQSNSDLPKTPTTPGVISILESASSEPQETHTSKRTPHAWIGVSLISGFILMYLIDTLPTLSPPTPPSRTMNVYSLSDLSATSPPTPDTHLPKRSLSTTIGLVIHSAADGIALGASSTQPSLSFIIFLAIMIHKAPAAFGLTSVLLKQGLGKRAARGHLLVFSLAAPTGAIGTWFIARLLRGAGQGLGVEETTRWWTGVLLLFSGGTFLYVAMHSMQEDDQGHSGHDESPGNGYLDGNHRRDSRQKSGRSLRLVLAAVAGMLLPLLTQIGHAH